MIEDWKPQWTANDIRTVALPLLFLFSFVYGLYALRYCSDLVNTVPWHSTILIRPITGAFGAGFIVYFLYILSVNACVLISRELNR